MAIRVPSKRSHMPYLAELDSGPVMLYCTSDELRTLGDSQYVPWKIHWLDEGGEPRRIETGFPDDAVECSPMLSVNDGGVRVSFAAGIVHPRGYLSYRLYEMAGRTLDDLSEPVMLSGATASIGGATADCLFMSSGTQVLVTFREFDAGYSIRTPFGRLYRVTKVFKGEGLILTGKTGDRYQSFLYRPAKGTAREILVNGQSVYKCSILREEIAYTQKSSDEDRQIRFGRWSQSYQEYPFERVNLTDGRDFEGLSKADRERIELNRQCCAECSYRRRFESPTDNATLTHVRCMACLCPKGKAISLSRGTCPLPKPRFRN